ncbi:hypothetical protein Q7A53_05400 [Halobacillus rhizosphaerae]|uniref:hypothetical protein n=1 Tax=Halobacillus rhizosphaerae TaxID=3064889 RepID=UPI00398A6290
MRLLLLICLSSILFFTGCESTSTIENAVIKDKIKKKIDCIRCYDDFDYYIIVEKDNQRIELEVASQTYRAVKKENIVNVSYDGNYFVKDLNLSIAKKKGDSN